MLIGRVMLVYQVSGFISSDTEQQSRSPTLISSLRNPVKITMTYIYYLA